MKNKIIVTGGAGFIGSHLVDKLIEKKYEVFVIDNLSTGKRENINKGAKFFLFDIREKEGVFKIFKEVKPEIVYHLAAQASVSLSMKDPLYDMEVNLLGGLNVLMASLKNNVKRFIFSSTGGAIYGEVPEGKRAKEEWKANPESVYGASKASFEFYLKALSKGKMEYVILRFSNVYGPRQDPYGEAGVVAIFCNSIAKGKPVKLFAKEKKGDKGCIRDYIYVGDVISACLYALKIKEGIYNVGTGIGRETMDVYKEILKNSKNSSKVIFEDKRIGDLKRNVLNCEKLKKFNWKPKTNFFLGIKKTYDLFLRKENL